MAINGLRFRDDRGRLVELLDWIENQPELGLELARLRSVKIDEMVGLHGFSPRVDSQLQRVGFGLYLFDEAKLGHDLHATAMRVHIHARDVQGYINEAVESFINPFLDHIGEIIESLGSGLSIEKVVQLRFDVLKTPEFITHHQETTKGMAAVQHLLNQPEEVGQWMNVAVSCREIVGAYVKALVRDSTVIPQAELKQGDFKGILKQLAKEKQNPSDGLVNLIQERLVLHTGKRASQFCFKRGGDKSLSLD